LISQAWISITHFDLVKTLLANIKKTFVLAKARRAQYLSFLSRNGVQNPINVPLPVATRWNSWFKMAFYINDHYQLLQNFYLEEQKNDSNEIIEKLAEIFNDTTKNGCIQIYLFFYQNSCTKIHK